MSCKICGAPRHVAFEHLVLNKYLSTYEFCDRCGLLQARDPHWLDEAYSDAIADTDTGLVQRNLLNANLLTVLLATLFERQGRFLDIAGGYGMLTRLMRDGGFDFYWSDKYCSNLLARGFGMDAAEPPFVAVTAFEVLEHVQDPLAFVKEALAAAQTRSIFFSTELFSGRPPPPTWWYYMFDAGQHISFYQRKTLHAIAQNFSLNCYSRGNIHLLTDRNISPHLFRILTTPRLVQLLAPLIRRTMESKTLQDHETVRRAS